ncbi:molybdate ABC transporter substrate-binding protein [Cobetia crustatorum]|uniref:molybdate ABC transporter substrate-binding protein n=1 Tax=Cobetia crustatorum TaxID=553385 RepID=UPI00200B9279|nr:molybdate ABC transporter substrate-binding protein [Cobetia crustatorum]
MLRFPPTTRSLFSSHGVPFTRWMASGVVAMVASLSLAPVHAAEQAQIRVMAAASLHDAMDAIEARYERLADVDIMPVYASSSTLARQLASGAPAQLYLSANERWMDWLEQQPGIVVTGRHDLLGNRLSLVAPGPSELDPTLSNGADVTNIAERLAATGDDTRLAVGDPDHVPAGIYARQSLESLGQWEALRSHLASAEDVRAALALVEHGEAPLGIVYATDASVSHRVHQIGLLPDSSHDPIHYPAALISRGGESPSPEAEAFRDWLSTNEASAIFHRFGFTTLQGAKLVPVANADTSS